MRPPRSTAVWYRKYGLFAFAAIAAAERMAIEGIVAWEGRGSQMETAMDVRGGLLRRDV